MVDRLKGDEDLHRRLRALKERKADNRILREWGNLAVAFAKSDVPRKTGNLGRSIRVASVNMATQTATIEAGGDRNVGYAAYVEFGTRQHIIVPRRARVLAWGGKRRLSGNLASGAKPTNFAKRVKHPGTKAYRYLGNGAKKALDKVGLADGVITVWNRAA